MLKKFHAALRKRLQGKTDRIWFQQDEAPPHRAGENLTWLRERFGTRLISIGAPTAWPASSPDLTPLEYFRWGHIKSRVYHSASRTIPDLKSEVRRRIRQVKASLSTCRSVLNNLKKRASLCLERNGGHFEHVL